MVGCEVNEISDCSKLVFMLGVFHEKTWYSYGFFYVVVIIEVLVTCLLDKFCWRIPYQSLEKTYVFFSECISCYLFVIFIWLSQLLESTEKNIYYHRRFYFLDKHGQFICFDILLQIFTDRKAKNIAGKFLGWKELNDFTSIFQEKWL